MCSTFSKCFPLWNFCCCLDSNPKWIYLLKHCPFNTLFCAKINAIKTKTQPQPTARTILHYDHFIFSLANKQKLYQQNSRKNEKVNQKVNILVGIKTNTYTGVHMTLKMNEATFQLGEKFMRKFDIFGWRTTFIKCYFCRKFWTRYWYRYCYWCCQLVEKLSMLQKYTNWYQTFLEILVDLTNFMASQLIHFDIFIINWNWEASFLMKFVLFCLCMFAVFVQHLNVQFEKRVLKIVCTFFSIDPNMEEPLNI